MTTSDAENRQSSLTRLPLRGPAAMILGGHLVFVVAGLLHPAHEAANDHPAVFAEYARSDAWTLIHLAQFVGLALTMAGIVLLLRALPEGSERTARISRLAAGSAVVTVATYAVLQAVDGVALKQSVDAWASAADPTRVAVFSTAETVRWIEWGVRSYQQLMQGVTLVLLAVVLFLSAQLPRGIAYLAGAAGIAVAAAGLVIGFEGFSDASNLPGILAVVLGLAWAIWLAVAVRIRTATSAGPR